MCTRYDKIERKDTNRPAQSTKTRHASFSLTVSSHHIPLLGCHSPSTVREKHSCRDSRPLGSITRLPGLMHFVAQHVQGHVAAQCYLSQLPILQENRDHATKPHATRWHATLRCKHSLHILPSREPLEDTLSSSDQASPSLSPTLVSLGNPLSLRPLDQESSPPLPSSAITCKAMSAHILRTSAEKGVRMSALRRRRARHAARTSLAHSTPWMLCVNTHHPSDPSRATRPPRSASPTNFGGSHHQPLENTPFTKYEGQDPLARIFNTSEVHPVP